jgi:hypothetical protein
MTWLTVVVLYTFAILIAVILAFGFSQEDPW